jgi:CubicO group peptidase (beta-lactamase class C family)
VIKDGEVVFERGYGYADLENKVRIDANSSFRLASISKHITTTAIMVLAEDGKLSPDDLLADHVPEYGHWPGVTLHHMMAHLSGIPGYYEDYTDAEGEMPQNGDLLEIMARYPDADYPPGERHGYNNSAYDLLVEVVERASGMSFTDFLTERVFKPANMLTATTFSSSRPDIPNRVFGYRKGDDGYESADYDILNDILGSGGVYASLKDLTAWDHALHNETVVTEETRRTMVQSAQTNDGEATAYGYGWRLNSFRGHRRESHTVLTNGGGVRPSAAMEEISAMFLEGRGNTFISDESQASVMEHHRRYPTDDHWWNVRGPEQGWLHRHVDQLFPTTTVYRSGQVSELDYSLNDKISAVSVDTPDGPMPFGRFIHSDHSTNMGVVILHKGKIVFESYPRMQEYEKTTYWSTTKTLAGSLVRILEERGLIDVSKPIDYYVPALAESVHAGTTVRNVLAMATGVDCTENYTDPESCYYRYSMAIGDNLRTPDAPDNPYDFMASVEIERERPQGEQFVYSGGTNFLLMWLVEEVTGYPYQDAVTKEFWRHIGAENDAGFIAYRYGISMSHGGFHSKMRDLARFGLLYTPSWSVVSDTKVISDEHIAALFEVPNPKLVRSMGGEENPQRTQNVYAWGVGLDSGYISHGGWGGQGLIIHPEKDVVAVFTGYTKDDYSEVPMQPNVFKVLNEVFVDAD